MRYPLFIISRKAQAMTEVVLLLPIFIIIMVFIVKIFALLILIQKIEIASYYAARRWQLQSHLNVKYVNSGDDERLRINILDKVKDYIGFNDYAVREFLNLDRVDLDVNRTMVWNIVTLTVHTKPIPQGLQKLLCRGPEVCSSRAFGQKCMDGYQFFCSAGRDLKVIKYVPNRDRPLQFKLPGLE